MTPSMCALMDLGGTCSIERLFGIQDWWVLERAPMRLEQILLHTDEDDST
jgi:hypothetical protein